MWTYKGRTSVRRLWPSDLPAFKDHLHRLDRETLYNRFGGYASAGFLDEYAAKCFTDGGVVYGYFSNGLLRGAGELRQAEHALEAEAAFSVEAAWRRKGIGSALFTRVIGTARNRQIGTLSILCLPHNQAMLELAHKFEAELQFENDAITGRLIARKLSPLSVWTEYVEDNLGFFGAMIDAQQRFWRDLSRKISWAPISWTAKSYGPLESGADRPTS